MHHLNGVIALAQVVKHACLARHLWTSTGSTEPHSNGSFNRRDPSADSRKPSPFAVNAGTISMPASLRALYLAFMSEDGSHSAFPFHAENLHCLFTFLNMDVMILCPSQQTSTRNIVTVADLLEEWIWKFLVAADRYIDYVSLCEATLKVSFLS